MKIITIFFLAAITSCFLQNAAFAQPDLWEIYTVSDQPFVNVIIDKYESDSLYIKFMDRLIVLHQDSIKYLIRRKESEFGLGFLIGAVIGGIAFNAMPQDDDEFFSGLGRFTATIFGILIGGTIGGIAGLAAGTDKEYQIGDLNAEDKTELLNRLFD